MVGATSEGYLPRHREIRFKEYEEGGRSMVAIYLEPNKKVPNPAPDHLLFAKSRSTLLDESIGALEHLVRIMMEDPSVRIELAGHTDALGSSEAKKKLSVERVERIREYLLQYGIEKKRIQTVGYGGARPNAPNDTEQNRAKNRRVEVRILEADS
jgi:outer membrane protein OmpA-like peptidoglycan-associated protein